MKSIPNKEFYKNVPTPFVGREKVAYALVNYPSAYEDIIDYFYKGLSCHTGYINSGCKLMNCQNSMEGNHLNCSICLMAKKEWRHSQEGPWASGALRGNLIGMNPYLLARIITINSLAKRVIYG